MFLARGLEPGHRDSWVLFLFWAGEDRQNIQHPVGVPSSAHTQKLAPDSRGSVLFP
jgi:hypothetical protein